MDNKEKILKFCGFYQEDDRASFNVWRYPDGREKMPPDFDMSFFFKWVVPKLNEYDIYWHGGNYWTILDGHISQFGSTPEAAWQEALLKLIAAEVPAVGE